MEIDFNNLMDCCDCRNGIRCGHHHNEDEDGAYLKECLEENCPFNKALSGQAVVSGQKLSWHTCNAVEKLCDELTEKLRKNDCGECDLYNEAADDYRNDVAILKQFLNR